MNSSYCKAIVVASLVLMVRGTASGQTPPDNDVTDSGGNTGGGSFALAGGNAGSFNTAYGFGALQYNSGAENTAIGQYALNLNLTGNRNTASGTGALELNIVGSYNTASGFESLFSNKGTGNTASGYQSLYYNTSNYNTAHGYGALLHTTTGANNIAVGANAGLNLTTGSNNIDIGHPGVAGEGSTIRLGNGQARTFIAGIAGTPVVGVPVFTTNSGQLGVLLSSARYKRDIQDMGKQSHGLLKLRPVTFSYTTDTQGEKQYGLIAEEVAKVYPELVTQGTDGKVEAVRYHELIPMLLNELQHQQQQIGAQGKELAALRAQNASLQTMQGEQLAELKAQNAALIARLDRLEEVAVRPAALARR